MYFYWFADGVVWTEYFISVFGVCWRSDDALYLSNDVHDEAR